MALNNRLKEKLKKMCHDPRCPVCNKEVDGTEADELEYVKTKRGTEIFIHTECVKKWSE